jgi:hypothetical protein
MMYIRHTGSTGTLFSVGEAGVDWKFAFQITGGNQWVVATVLEGGAQNIDNLTVSTHLTTKWMIATCLVEYNSGANQTTLQVAQDGAVSGTLTRTGYFLDKPEYTKGVGFLRTSADNNHQTIFIYEFRIFNYKTSDTSKFYYPNCNGGGAADVCVISSRSMRKLPVCDINQYWNGSACVGCLGACGSDGCRRGTDCNMCAHPLCKVCNNLHTSDGCETCQTNASTNIEGFCECDDAYWYNPANADCATSCGCAKCTTNASTCTAPICTENG